MSGLRQRKKTFGRTVEDLDAFPKVAEPYVEQEASSAIGKKSNFNLTNSVRFSIKFGLFSVYIITMVLVFILIYNEWTYFLNPDPVFKFVPDADFAAKLQINIDMTVAMPCDSKYISDQSEWNTTFNMTFSNF